MHPMAWIATYKLRASLVYRAAVHMSELRLGRLALPIRTEVAEQHGFGTSHMNNFQAGLCLCVMLLVLYMSIAGHCRHGPQPHVTV